MEALSFDAQGDLFEVVTIDPASARFTLSVLLEVAPGRAHAVAMLNAAATVTRVQSLSGFVSAIFMTSAEDDHVFEIVEWESAAALSEARSDHRYSDHIDILHDHAKTVYLGMSTLVATDVPFAMTRGDSLMVSLADVPDAVAENVASTIAAAKEAGTLSHVAATPEGAAVVSLRLDDLGLEPMGVERWRRRLRVVEAISSRPSAVGRPVHYRLLDSAAVASAPIEAAHA